MIRIWLLLAVGSLAAVSYDAEHQTNRGADDELVLSGTGDDSSPIADVKSDEKLERKRRQSSSSRTALSLPDNTSLKIAFDMSVGISPLNNTFSSFTMSLPFRFVLPTFTQLNNRYGSLDQLEKDLSDEGQMESNLIDYEFLEEQRANEQRRTVYQHIEILFKKFGFDGEVCMQRAICELAEAPLAHHGILGKLMHLVFTPSLLEFPKIMRQFLTAHGNSNNHRVRRDATLLPELELIEKPLEDQYTHAYRTGKENKCWARYSSCPISLFTLLNI